MDTLNLIRMAHEIQVSNASNNTHTIFKHTNWWTHYFVSIEFSVFSVFNFLCCIWLSSQIRVSYEIKVFNALDNIHTIFKHTNLWTHYIVQIEFSVFGVFNSLCCIWLSSQIRVSCEIKVFNASNNVHTKFKHTNLWTHYIVSIEFSVFGVFNSLCCNYDWVLKLECHTKLRLPTH